MNKDQSCVIVANHQSSLDVLGEIFFKKSLKFLNDLIFFSVSGMFGELRIIRRKNCFAQTFLIHLRNLACHEQDDSDCKARTPLGLAFWDLRVAVRFDIHRQVFGRESKRGHEPINGEAKEAEHKAVGVSRRHKTQHWRFT